MSAACPVKRIWMPWPTRFRPWRKRCPASASPSWARDLTWTGSKTRFAGRKDVHFTGVVHGESLAGLFASADMFVFPSLTDTFGNSVVESLASGVPCITSDEGGPREIIVDGECGLVFEHAVPGDLEAKVLALALDPPRLLAFKAKARERAMLFTYDRSADAFWDFYTRFHQNKL